MRVLTPQLDVRLTPREQQVLVLIWKGRTNEAIGKQLGISVRTIEAHRHNLYRKTQCTNVAMMLRWGIDHGILNGKQKA